MGGGLRGPDGVRVYLEATGRLARAFERGAISPEEYRAWLDAIHAWLEAHDIHVAPAPDLPTRAERAVVPLYCRAKGRLELAARRGVISEEERRRRLDSIHAWLRERGIRVSPGTA